MASLTNQTDPGLLVPDGDGTTGCPISISLVAMLPLTSDVSLTLTLVKGISFTIVLFEIGFNVVLTEAVVPILEFSGRLVVVVVIFADPSVEVDTAGAVVVTGGGRDVVSFVVVILVGEVVVILGA